MKAALHSDIGHAGNKGEDKKLDMTLTNLDNMRRKTEVYMSSQRKSFVAGLEKKQGTWIREHQRTATKSNNQAKLRKENRQRVAQEEARKTKEKKAREDKELQNERDKESKMMPSKMFTRQQLAPRKSMLPSIDDIYEPVETPPPPKENKSVTFRKLARAIGMASISFGKMGKGEGEEAGGTSDNASLFKKKVSTALEQEEKFSFSNLVMKIKAQQQKEQNQTLETIHEKELEEKNRIKEEKAQRERQRRLAEQQKLPPLLRRGSIVSSILKEADDREEETDEIMKQEQPVLSGPDPVLISEVLPKIEITKANSQPAAQHLPHRRRRRSRRRKDLTKSKVAIDPLKDERFVTLQHLLKPELKKKDTELSGLTTNILAAKKYARWWKAGTLNAASHGGEA